MKQKTQQISKPLSETLKLGTHTLTLNFEPQTTPKGRPIRYSGLNTENGIDLYSFKYLDKHEWLNLPFKAGKFQQSLFSQYNTPNK